MITKFRPDKYYKNVFEVNYKLLKKEGIKLITCDLDNTLVPHDVLDAPKNVIDLFDSLEKAGLLVVVISNNNEKRVKRFCEKLDIKYYYSSKKPLKMTFKKVLKDFNLKANDVCLVGDQLMTDVFGANRMKITSIFVEPLAQRDIIYTKFNRQIERLIIKILEKKKLFKMGEYYE
ncbi:HAD superfamily phosphatase (TIGR01668 family) [Bacilli bacterium PM5-3]|nr:HAD superfamily phosphatase (TIGR01668 family) [Bacilli bacterium PM5-3]MDH6603951.1 HAD superfamily phosphatase (TIGR01668 family) [Bacilli bacterium PM5-9]